MSNIHATSLVYKNKGILLIGPSGSGKSDIALRLIMNKSAKLIADDRTDISIENGKIYASCPKAIEGFIEVRGIGLKKVDFLNRHQIDIAIELVKDLSQIERIPELEFYDIEGIKIPKIKLYSFEASALEKIDISLI